MEKVLVASDRQGKGARQVLYSRDEQFEHDEVGNRTRQQVTLSGTKDRWPYPESVDTKLSTMVEGGRYGREKEIQQGVQRTGREVAGNR
jgi:hypothetical protein